MFKKLDNLIMLYGKDTSIMREYWYDEGCDKAIEIIGRFQENDWNDLINSLPNKSLVWKQRLAYCLLDNTNIYNLKVLEMLSDTDDVEFLGLIISILNRFDVEKMTNYDEIARKIEMYMPLAGNLDKKYFESFLNKKR